jgi:hypothetical protein
MIRDSSGPSYLLSIVLLGALLCFCGGLAMAETARPARRGASQEAAAEGDAGKLVQTEMDELRESTQQWAMRTKRLAWIIVVGLFLAGCVSAFAGWWLIRTFFVPICLLTGVLSGGAAGWAAAGRLGASGAAALIATAAVALAMMVLYGVASVKAKPIGAYLLGLSPFLLFSAGASRAGYTGSGVIVLVAGLLVSLLVLRRTRLVMVILTAVQGALLWIAAAFMLDALIRVPGAAEAKNWLATHPLAWLVIVLFLCILGMNIQYTLGPGALTEEERVKWRRARGRAR